MKISVILPAKNEAEGLRSVLPALRACLPDAEVIMVGWSSRRKSPPQSQAEQESGSSRT